MELLLHETTCTAINTVAVLSFTIAAKLCSHSHIRFTFHSQVVPQNGDQKHVGMALTSGATGLLSAIWTCPTLNLSSTRRSTVSNLHFFHTQERKFPNLQLNSWFSLPGSYRLTIRLSVTHPKGRCHKPFFQVMVVLWSEVRTQAYGTKHARSLEGCDGGPAFQFMYINSSFTSPGVIVMKGGGWICWLSKLLPCANLWNTTGKSYSLCFFFTWVEKLARFLSQLLNCTPVHRVQVAQAER